MGTSCPDHFLRTRISPMFVPWDPASQNEAALRTAIATRIATYRDDYHAYYQAFAEPSSPALRDSNPSVVVIPGLGLFGFGKDKREARITTEFFVNAIHVMQGAAALEEDAAPAGPLPQVRRPDQAREFRTFHNYVALPRLEAFRIEYWALEEAKLQRMEELAVTVAQQARIYLAELPRQVRGEVDLVRSELLPAENLASMQSDFHMSAAAADRLASTAEGLPSILPNERRIVLDEMNHQRILVTDAVSLERARAVGPIIRAFAAERAEFLRSFEAQRLATLEWATAERRDAILDMHRELAGSMVAMRAERTALVADVRRLVDVVLLRVAAFLIAAVVLAPLVAHAYARVWPRRWRDPPKREDMDARP